MRHSRGWHGHPMLRDRASLAKGTVTQRRVVVPPPKATPYSGGGTALDPRTGFVTIPAALVRVQENEREIL